MPEIEAKNIVKYFKHDKHTLKAINDICADTLQHAS